MLGAAEAHTVHVKMGRCEMARKRERDTPGHASTGLTKNTGHESTGLSQNINVKRIDLSRLQSNNYKGEDAWLRINTCQEAKKATHKKLRKKKT